MVNTVNNSRGSTLQVALEKEEASAELKIVAGEAEKADDAVVGSNGVMTKIKEVAGQAKAYAAEARQAAGRFVAPVGRTAAEAWKKVSGENTRAEALVRGLQEDDYAQIKTALGAILNHEEPIQVGSQQILHIINQALQQKDVDFAIQVLQNEACFELIRGDLQDNKGHLVNALTNLDEDAFKKWVDVLISTAKTFVKDEQELSDFLVNIGVVLSEGFEMFRAGSEEDLQKKFDFVLEKIATLPINLKDKIEFLKGTVKQLIEGDAFELAEKLLQNEVLQGADLEELRKAFKEIVVVLLKGAKQNHLDLLNALYKLCEKALGREDILKALEEACVLRNVGALKALMSKLDLTTVQQKLAFFKERLESVDFPQTAVKTVLEVLFGSDELQFKSQFAFLEPVLSEIAQNPHIQSLREFTARLIGALIKAMESHEEVDYQNLFRTMKEGAHSLTSFIINSNNFEIIEKYLKALGEMKLDKEGKETLLRHVSKLDFLKLYNIAANLFSGPKEVKAAQKEIQALYEQSKDTLLGRKFSSLEVQNAIAKVKAKLPKVTLPDLPDVEVKRTLAKAKLRLAQVKAPSLNLPNPFKKEKVVG